jgi:ribosomal protein S12 methylthiotransferase accessory factor
MLALALEDYEKALEWNSWSLHIGELNQEDKQHHHCINALLEIVMDDEKSYGSYRESLELLYGAKTLQTCVDLVQSKTQFHGLHFPGLSLDGFETHQALLAGYKKLHKAKEKSSL